MYSFLVVVSFALGLLLGLVSRGITVYVKDPKEAPRTTSLFAPFTKEEEPKNGIISPHNRNSTAFQE